MPNGTIQTAYDLIQTIVKTYWGYGLGAGAVSLFIYMITHPEKVELWGSIFYRIFSFISKSAERRSVSTDIQARLNSFIKNFKVEDVLPYGLRFRWITGVDFESYVDDGDVVVVMDYHKNNARNFIKAIMAYTSQGLLPNVRNYLPHNILMATEITVQEKIIGEKRSDALKIFRDETIPQYIKDNPEVEKNLNKFRSIERSGYFDTIFLNELAYSGGKLQDFSKQIGITELDAFIAFLEQLANREPMDDTTQLNNDGKIFRPWVILVAIQGKLATQGITPYVKRAEEAVSKQFHSVYLQIREQNFNYADTLIDAIKKVNCSFKWKKFVTARDKGDRFSKALMVLFRI